MNWTEYARQVRMELLSRSKGTVALQRVPEGEADVTPAVPKAPRNKETRWTLRDRVRAMHAKLGIHTYMQCPGTKCSARPRPL